LGRDFAFIALGGATDSSFLEGHSYTYEGSTWGKIVDILIHCNSMNPVIYFDELDKISETAKGEEIAGILTHLTDTSQNASFHDKYFAEIDFDLSKCLFIFSYNDASRVNPILLDRMYRIEANGYSKKDKTQIAQNYLIPKICKEVGFATGDIVISDEVIEYIVEHMTDGEEGVRNLKRCLEIIHTKLNLFRLISNGKEMFDKEMNMIVEFPYTVSIENVGKLIKKVESKFHSAPMSLYI
jgi:ATP-dependent Lon protease